MRKLIPFLAIILTQLACQDNFQNSEEASDLVGDVYLQSNGEVTFNKEVVSLDSLDKLLGTLAVNKGLVRYSRANMDNDPPSIGMEVVSLIIHHDLPIQLFTDSTYTTAVEGD